MTDLNIGPATGADTEAILDLLARAGLPAAGLVEHLPDVLVARDGERIVGTVALERYAEGALLRSVAVDASRRGSGVGLSLTEAAIRRARALGVPALFLLTTTAERFFPKFGFEPIGRADVPASVQASLEFTTVCPASAVVMRKVL